MATVIPKDVTKPKGAPPQGSKPEKADKPFVPNEPEQEGGEEVSGRDLRYDHLGRLWYPNYWHRGYYIWVGDGDVWYGDHWHPYANSPIAFDVRD
jgi:hypothetical protein